MILTECLPFLFQKTEAHYSRKSPFALLFAKMSADAGAGNLAARHG
jgi:hypothetical protein